MHVFMGQIRWYDLDDGAKRFLARRHRVLALEKAGVSFDQLWNAYSRLRVRDTRAIRMIDTVLVRLAGLLAVIGKDVENLHTINTFGDQIS
jgi:hypothetical protein